MTTDQQLQRFSGKVAVVTGAASGIGREAALQLAAEGAAVCCADVNETGLEEVAGEISRRGGKMFSQRLDVTVEADWETAIAKTLSAYGKLNVLVHCAGVSSAAPITEMTFDEWRRVLAINLDGAFLGTKHAVRS